MGFYAYRKVALVKTRMLSSEVLEISFRCRDGADYRAGNCKCDANFASGGNYCVTAKRQRGGPAVTSCCHPRLLTLIPASFHAVTSM